MAVQRQIILDTETTGLYAQGGDRLVEFAGLEMVNRQLTGRTLHLYIHPDRDIPQEVVNVHGITLEWLEEQQAPKFEVVGQQIADFLAGAELIIHNAPFDVGFLDMEFAKAGLPSVEELDCTITDTVVMARKMFPGQKVSLDALCQRFDVDKSKRVYHGALIDCELLAEVYLAMTRAQFSLTDAFQGEEAAAIVAKQPRPKVLKVLPADATELVEHEAYLDALDKASDGLCVWRQPDSEQVS